MNVFVSIPDDLAQRLSAGGGDIARRALEALAIEEYRSDRLTDSELCQLLGFESRLALDAFLKARGVFLDYDIADLEQDRRSFARLDL